MRLAPGRVPRRRRLWSRGAWLLAGTLAAAPGAGATVIGGTLFPLGELAFPDLVTCLDAGGCGGEVLVVDASFDPVSPAQALIGHELGLVAVDLGPEDVLAIRFPVPIRDQPGPDLLLGQAQFLGELGGASSCAGSGAAAVHGAGIRAAGATGWHALGCADFEEDAGAGVTTVFYADPEIKSDAYALWIAAVDLAALGVAPGATIDGFDLRGPQGGGLDAALAGNLNVPEPGTPALLLLACAALAATRRSARGLLGRAPAAEPAQLARQIRA
jgi:hypothetical protein